MSREDFLFTHCPPATCHPILIFPISVDGHYSLATNQEVILYSLSASTFKPSPTLAEFTCLIYLSQLLFPCPSFHLQFVGLQWFNTKERNKA